MYFYNYEIFFYDDTEEKNCKAVGLVCGDSYEDAISKISNYYGNIIEIKITIISENPMPLCDSSNNTEEDFASAQDLITRVKENIIW